MNLCCRKGHFLVFKHQIKIDLNSGFEFQNNFVFVNKHKIIRVRGDNPSIKINPEKAKFHCQNCKVDYLFKDTYIFCENCSKIVLQRVSKKMGVSLLLCTKCHKQAKTYRAFDIFKLLTATASQIAEIDIDNFHDYSWEDILERFGGEELSPAPENVSDFVVEREDNNAMVLNDGPIEFTSRTSISPALDELTARAREIITEDEMNLEERGMQDNTE